MGGWAVGRGGATLQFPNTPPPAHATHVTSKNKKNSSNGTKRPTSYSSRLSEFAHFNLSYQVSVGETRAMRVSWLSPVCFVGNSISNVSGATGFAGHMDYALQGGQSALRISRLAEEVRANYVRIVAEKARSNPAGSNGFRGPPSSRVSPKRVVGCRGGDRKSDE